MEGGKKRGKITGGERKEGREILRKENKVRKERKV